MDFTDDELLDWQRRFCQNRACDAWVWLVCQAPCQDALWVISENGNDYMQVVAAVSPVCPACGTELLTSCRARGRVGESSGAETGPLFDFVRSLP